MAAPQSQAGAAISQTAKAEGGPAKGSTSAQMQAEVGRQRNFEQAAQEVGSKLQNAPETVTSQVRFTSASEQVYVLSLTFIYLGRQLPQVS